MKLSENLAPQLEITSISYKVRISYGIKLFCLRYGVVQVRLTIALPLGIAQNLLLQRFLIVPHET